MKMIINFTICGGSNGGFRLDQGVRLRQRPSASSGGVRHACLEAQQLAELVKKASEALRRHDRAARDASPSGLAH
jgi:hypothetical protein